MARARHFLGLLAHSKRQGAQNGWRWSLALAPLPSTAPEWFEVPTLEGREGTPMAHCNSFEESVPAWSLVAITFLLGRASSVNPRSNQPSDLSYSRQRADSQSRNWAELATRAPDQILRCYPMTARSSTDLWLPFSSGVVAARDFAGDRCHSPQSH